MCAETGDLLPEEPRKGWLKDVKGLEKCAGSVHSGLEASHGRGFGDVEDSGSLYSHRWLREALPNGVGGAGY